MGNPWRPGRNATFTKVPSTLPVIGWHFNDISSFARVCTAVPSQHCLCSTSFSLPERGGLMGELLPRQGRKDHLVDEPAGCRLLMTRPPLWVAKTRWIKSQPEPRTLYKLPAEVYLTRNAEGTEKRNRCGNHAGAGARSVMHSVEAILTTAPYASQPQTIYALVGTPKRELQEIWPNQMSLIDREWSTRIVASGLLAFAHMCSHTPGQTPTTTTKPQ